MRARSHKLVRCFLPLDLVQFHEANLGTYFFCPLRPKTKDNLDFEVAFYEEVLQSAPDHPEALAVLGEVYVQRGEFAKSLATDLRLSQLRPANRLVQYNLACSYALNGEKENALRALHQALKLGYSDLKHLRQDPDLDSLREDPRYQAMERALAQFQAVEQK